jgi:transposase-like protein
MARLSKSTAARQLGISRTTLYKLIDQGHLSATPDGLIDSTELVRVAPVVDTLKERARTSMDTATIHQETPAVQADEHREHFVDSNREHPWTDVHARQQTSTDTALVDIVREQLAEMRHELRAAREERQAAREERTVLLQMLQEMQHRYDRLLEAPRSVPVAGPSLLLPTERQPTATRGDMRRRIVALLQEHPEGLSPAQTRQLLGVEKRLTHTMVAMARDGLLRRVAQGRYGVA